MFSPKLIFLLRNEAVIELELVSDANQFVLIADVVNS